MVSNKGKSSSHDEEDEGHVPEQGIGFQNDHGDE